jgi:hypothetical protein
VSLFVAPSFAPRPARASFVHLHVELRIFARIAADGPSGDDVQPSGLRQEGHGGCEVADGCARELTGISGQGRRETREDGTVAIDEGGTTARLPLTRRSVPPPGRSG